MPLLVNSIYSLIAMSPPPFLSSSVVGAGLWNLYGDDISFADLPGYHELLCHVAGAILGEADWRKLPKVKQWYDRLSERPHAQAVNEMIMQVGAMRQAGELIPMTRKTSLAKGTEVIAGVYN